jgi:hypothetical protein
MELQRYFSILFILTIPFGLFCQDLAPNEAMQKATDLVISPNPLTVRINETKAVDMMVIDQNGAQIQQGKFSINTLRKSGAVPSSGVLVDSSHNVKGMQIGTYSLVVIWTGLDNQFQLKYLTVHVKNWEPASIQIDNVPEQITQGTKLALDLKVFDQKGAGIENGKIKVVSSRPDVISVDPFNQITALKPGMSQIEASISNVKTSVKLTVVPSGVSELTLECQHAQVRTGDVVYFEPVIKDSQGSNIDVPVTYSLSNAGNTSEGAFAIIREDGAFVAERPGFYTITAIAGDRSASRSISVVDRNVARDIEVVGRGTMTRKHTTDFWLWEGVDGNDYAVTGTFSADGMAYFWDITDASNIQLIDSVQVDARLVNDAKISEDGSICIISREGASSRKNGIVILDVVNPRDVKIISEYHEQLTGGVHNLFIYKDHVYALSNGQHYEIINIEDPKQPYRVGRFEIDNPARAIHDVWVADGIAYSSNWNDGVIMVDIGNGVAGGTPSNPVEISRSKVAGDANHTTFPFRSESAGRFYVVAGDEIFPVEWFTKGLTETLAPRGYVHIIDWTDKDNPKEVATYRVPEAGAHNYWVEDETLYIGYYTGGIRVVDLSGELMGDLYRQGREMGYFIPRDPDGKVPNMAMTWGARPYKGHVFFTDMNSGLWAVKVTPKQPEEAPVDIID